MEFHIKWRHGPWWNTATPPSRCRVHRPFPRKRRGRSLSSPPSCPSVPNHRNRSPRLDASGRWTNVDKGSRQNRRVTSGKALAPRAGPFEAGAGPRFRECPRALRRPLGAAGMCVGAPLGRPGVGSLGGGEQPAWNCYGLGESNCLLETQLCARSPRVLAQSDFCPVL